MKDSMLLGKTAEELSAQKAKLVDLMLARKTAQQRIELLQRDVTATKVQLPASWAQQRLWFFDQLEGGSSAYNIPLVLRLHGALDEDALLRALHEIVQRHEVLRTTFVNVDGEPRQEIAAAGALPLYRADLSSDDEATRATRLRLHCAEEAQTPFDLRTGPLIRGRLLRLHPQEHVVLITMHHIVSDGWSIGVLMDELAALYAAGRAGRAAALEPLAIQYADYAHWQRQWLRDEVLENQLTYWRARLQGASASLELPTDRPRPAVQSFRGAAVAVRLNATLTVQLKSLAQRHGMTLFMLLYGAWALLLARLSGQDDVLVGTPIANRRRPEVERLIGFFVNMLVLRVDAAGDARIGDYLRRVREVALEAYDHQDMPFEQLVEALKPERSLSRHPIFQVGFVLQNVPQNWRQWPGLSVQVAEPEIVAAKFDLFLGLEERAGTIVGTLDYAADLFLEQTMQRWVAYFEVLLESIVAADEQALVGALQFIPADERRRILESFNASHSPFPHDKVVHELFEEQVRCAPEAIAVVYEDRTLTYDQLNRRANQLARYLRARRIGPDRVVGLCVERGLEMMVGILGVLKAGGAYVPLDASYPVERLAFMLEDSAPTVLLTLERLRERVPATSAHVIALDQDWGLIAHQDESNIDRDSIGLRPEHLANIIYTSGSTGRPKGVMVAHRGICNLATWSAAFLDIRPDSRVLQFSSHSFDAFTWEWILALCHGARLCLVPREQLIPGEPLLSSLRRHAVTHAILPPAGLAAMSPDDGLKSLTTLISGGEACSAAIVQRWAPGRRFINAYGPTEITVCASMYACDPGETGAPPIGRPLANTQLYILDSRRQLVPIGAVGELYIGGAGLTRGYLNRPELTAERFIADPFSTDTQARLYRTGDLVRWREDGAVEYLGRNDQQVKLRGLRIELGEIEVQLARHERVQQAVVLVRDDGAEKRLVAYVVPTDTSEIDARIVETLRAHLKTVLPEFMVPAAFVLLERFPMTPNGKLDRRALPAPNYGAYATRSYQAPLSQVEEIVAGIWQSLLGVERVGRHDNFFELGGHSLLIVQMLERLRRMGLSAEVRQVFASPTLAELAAALETEVAEQFAVPPNLIPEGCTVITPEMLPLISLEPAHIAMIERSVPGGAANIQDIYPLAPLQEGILFHHLLDEQAGDTYVLPMVFLVCSRARLDELIAALQTVVSRHEVLRTSVHWENMPQPVQVVYREARVPVAQIALDPEREPMDQIREWLRPERQRLDIRYAPLLRLAIAADPSTERWYALMQLHHITLDHVALQIVTSECLALLEKRAQVFPPSVPYRNHVAQSLAHARKYDSEGFFREKLSDVDEPTAPFGLLNVHGDGTQVEEAREQVDADLAARVRVQARRLGVSAATVFHAAWALVVAHTSGRDDVVFGTVLLGRLQGSAGAQRTLGMFINTLPLRLRLRDRTARQLVDQVQRELVELLSHEQASLAMVQRCSGIVGSAPLFSALFNFRHSVPDPHGEWSSAHGIQTVAGQERTNYPLTLSMDDLGEGFALLAQTDRRVDPRRVITYLLTAAQSLVSALEADAETAALALAVLPESERCMVLETFNATSAALPREKLIHTLIEEQVRREPDAVAVTYGEYSLTYAELNARSNQLARYLRKQGVCAGAIVGVCFDRSLDMVVALLGILKAGASYLPLDPSYPLERLQHMLQDAAPALVLTHEQTQGALPATPIRTARLDLERDQIDASGAGDPDPAVPSPDPDSLVYVIYTSGSTGLPKGTAMPHRAMVNLIEWHRTTFTGTAQPRVLQFAALSFDVAFQEIFSTLATGGTLILLDECVRRDARALLDLLCEQRVERLFVPPMMLQALAEYCRGEGSAPPALRDVITAGEQLRITPEIVAFFRRLGACRLHNHYGPTETHVVTTLTLAGDPEQWPALPTIGRPIANTQMYVLDAARRPVAVGVTGELYIAGASVARGYLHREQLTHERFLQDPFSSEPDARMYRTGDLGRWREDGTIEYLGRNDDQVKIRGFRIELGEIDARLSAHPVVKEAAVIIREDTPGERRLVAYITSRTPSSMPASEELRAHLKALLPEHMVPGAFVVLESLPLTPSGKLNRRALPAPEVGAYASSRYEAPEGRLEEALASIWRDTLGLVRVGRRDHFFEIGGHSLLALKMLLQVNQTLGCAIRVGDIYKNPTVRELAAQIEGQARTDDFVDLAVEALLDPAIVPLGGLRNGVPKTVALTGCTGFVGRFLLAELLNTSSATIYCLVRARSRHAAGMRLKGILSEWDLWREEFAERIVVIPADLRLPQLGLTDVDYHLLSREVDSIYHCATSMNHLETYAMAKPANVDAMRDLLRLATSGKPKLINYVSTLGVFGATAAEPTRLVDERTPIEREQYRRSQGYLASKWVAEKILLTARERGIPCNIFRLGLVWADAQQGRFDELQSVYRVLKTCVHSGYGIEDFRYPMPPTPVDYVARAMVVLAGRHRDGGGVFHISSSHDAIQGVFERCNEIAGTRLKLLPYYDWVCQIRRLHQSGCVLPAVPLLEWAFALDRDAFQRHLQNARTAAHIRFDVTRTQRELEQAGIASPSLNDALLRVCLEGMRSRDVDFRMQADEELPADVLAVGSAAGRHEGAGGAVRADARSY